MKYKALMLDIDGTLIPYDYESLPSKKVIAAVTKASRHLSVSIVTGRGFTSTKKILDKLGLTTGYAVVDGGAIVVDIKTEENLYEKFITKKDLDRIIKVFEEEKVDFFVKDKLSRGNRKEHYKPYIKGEAIDSPTMLFTDELYTLEKTNRVMKKLSYPNITIFRSKHYDPNKYSFNITHVQATKLHGIAVIKKILRFKKEEIIGVGDGYNDYPLLMASGLKVAMGNAVKDLKEIADYVAPSVTEDGVAVTIEKFILSSPKGILGDRNGHMKL